MAFLRILEMFFSPRGRMSRKGLLVAVGLLAVLETVGASMIWIARIDPASVVIVALKGVFVWIAAAAICKRLHDIGLSAWWLPTAAALEFAWTATLAVTMFVSVGIEQMQPGAESHSILLAGCAAPIIAAALWLHVSEGQASGNTYGPTPGRSGFSLPGASDPLFPAQTV
ncbi:MAG: hypothetical protein BGP06_06905 [Rhizobiales bacterium 65-9]|nr:DUF805 domain-containing protein [Hyphomicrobiales bacterium]OJY35558.1 MAG: hypothetical protein BGP06_06905 [Rhizobiales bacterium 65-9]